MSWAKFCVSGKVLCQRQNCVLGAKFHVEVASFMLGVKFWVRGKSISEMGQFNAKKFTGLEE